MTVRKSRIHDMLSGVLLWAFHQASAHLLGPLEHRWPLMHAPWGCDSGEPVLLKGPDSLVITFRDEPLLS